MIEWIRRGMIRALARLVAAIVDDEIIHMRCMCLVRKAIAAAREEKQLIEETASTIRMLMPLETRRIDLNYDQVLTYAIAEGGPAYNMTIAGDPVAEYLPEGVMVALRHRLQSDRLGVPARVNYPVMYQARGAVTVRFLNSNQTEQTDDGQRKQLARLERKG